MQRASLIILCVLFGAACGPSGEERLIQTIVSGTATALAWTPTPGETSIPTETLTPTPAPPEDLVTVDSQDQLSVWDEATRSWRAALPLPAGWSTVKGEGGAYYGVLDETGLEVMRVTAEVAVSSDGRIPAQINLEGTWQEAQVWNAPDWGWLAQAPSAGSAQASSTWQWRAGWVAPQPRLAVTRQATETWEQLRQDGGPGGSAWAQVLNTQYYRGIPTLSDYGTAAAYNYRTDEKLVTITADQYFHNLYWPSAALVDETYPDGHVEQAFYLLVIQGESTESPEPFLYRLRLPLPQLVIQDVGQSMMNVYKPEVLEQFWKALVPQEGYIRRGVVNYYVPFSVDACLTGWDYFRTECRRLILRYGSAIPAGEGDVLAKFSELFQQAYQAAQYRGFDPIAAQLKNSNPAWWLADPGVPLLMDELFGVWLVIRE